MPLIFLEKPFQLPICLRMSYASEYWLDTMPVEVFFETAVPAAVFMYSMGAEFAAVIHYQFSHGKKPPISIDHLFQDQFAVLSVYIGELATSKDLSGCIIKNNADFDVGSIHFIPIDMSC